MNSRQHLGASLNTYEEGEKEAHRAMHFLQERISKDATVVLADDGCHHTSLWVEYEGTDAGDKIRQQALCEAQVAWRRARSNEQCYKIIKLVKYTPDTTVDEIEVKTNGKART